MGNKVEEPFVMGKSFLKSAYKDPISSMMVYPLEVVLVEKGTTSWRPLPVMSEDCRRDNELNEHGPTDSPTYQEL